MKNFADSRLAVVLLAVVLTAALSGCSLLKGKLREHHFKDDESTALILDAKERVITQRAVNFDPESDKVKPGILICAEPSPDVANALSTAIGASLGASLPTNTGGKTFSAGFNSSQAESILQLGSRIATIQLLRDELADLCRSYANGAVSTTTYTLRLSRLDKKMVTLLLSEAAGRPGSAQALILGDAASGSSPSASREEIEQARQAVVTASADLVTKDKEFKEAAEATKSEKRLAYDAAIKALQEKQSALFALERRLLQTSGGAQAQSILVNDEAPERNQILSTLQENFLLQDDLTTFLDACISSLDRPQRPMNQKDQATIAQARDILKASEQKLQTAISEALISRARVSNAATDEEKRSAQMRLADAEAALNAQDADLRQANQNLEQVVELLDPLTPFGKNCQKSSLRTLLYANVDRTRDRIAWVEAQTRQQTMRNCQSLITSTDTATSAARAACIDAIAREAKGIADAAPRDLDPQWRTQFGRDAP